MRILVLGSTGMLGHKMVERLRPNFDGVIGVSRPAFDATNLASVDSVVSFFRPDVVLNCVGVIKQRHQDPALLKAVNSDLPHFLQRVSPYLIHFSTDCVFSGKTGMYTEDSTPDPVDLYGQSKLAGEVVADNALTIRTSIVGRERSNYHGLLEWFLHQTTAAPGYANAFFSGVTTNWLADIVTDIIRGPRLTGLYHVAGQRISKLDVLTVFKKTYKLDIPIIYKTVEYCDRSLNADKFKKATGVKPLGLEEMAYWMKKMDDEGSDYVR